MTNEPDETMGRTELLDRIERSWVAFQATVNGLDDGQLGTTGPDGWTVKDHLVHVERWEAYMLAELEGRSGRPELEVPETEEGPETDDINERLRASHAGLPAAEARTRLEDTHARMVALLGTLDEADLRRHLPRIAGNTHEHFDEHDGWIRTLTAAPAG
jgi:hypothetical protein